MSHKSPAFIIVLQDGDSSTKIRIQEIDLKHALRPYSGKDIASAMMHHLDNNKNNDSNDNSDAILTTIDVYDSNTKSFVPLVDQTDISVKFGESDLEVLAIEGRFFPFDNGMIISNDHSTRLLVREMPNIPGAGTGLNVWDGAILLVKFLEQNQQLIHAKNVLELGAGCGLVGIAASILGAHRVILTDLPYTMDHMRSNALNNRAEVGIVDCRVCDWFHPPDFRDDSWKSDVLLIADCVWIEELVAPLLRTISEILDSSTGAMDIIISYQRRGKSAHDLFWDGMSEMFEMIEKLDCLTDKPEQLNIYRCSTQC